MGAIPSRPSPAWGSSTRISRAEPTSSGDRANCVHDQRRVDLQCVRDLEEFNEIDPPSPSFDRGNDRLISAQSRGELALGQARPLTSFDEEFDQFSMTCASEGLGHRPDGGIEKADLSAKPDGKLSENLIFLAAVDRDSALAFREGAMTLWFTADHHFGHANIIRLCHRPFADVAEMDEAMVERWNAAIDSCDEVWHLGDFAYRCGPNRQAEIFSRLRGRAIHLVRGNHDSGRTLALPWASVQHYAEIVVDDRLLVLFHYAMRAWNRSHRGSLALHGHSHGTLPSLPGTCDVGVDVWNFRPVSLCEILRKIAPDPPSS